MRREWLFLIGVILVIQSVNGIKRALIFRRSREAPRRDEATCPSCANSPPIGEFWSCESCLKLVDLLADTTGCPKCRLPIDRVQCTECDQRHTQLEWFPAALAVHTEEPVAVDWPVHDRESQALLEAPKIEGHL